MLKTLKHSLLFIANVVIISGILQSLSLDHVEVIVEERTTNVGCHATTLALMGFNDVVVVQNKSILF
jgi:hypothetical protein